MAKTKSNTKRIKKYRTMKQIMGGASVAAANTSPVAVNNPAEVSPEVSSVAASVSPAEPLVNDSSIASPAKAPVNISAIAALAVAQGTNAQGTNAQGTRATTVPPPKKSTLFKYKNYSNRLSKSASSMGSYASNKTKKATKSAYSMGAYALNKSKNTRNKMYRSGKNAMSYTGKKLSDAGRVAASLMKRNTMKGPEILKDGNFVTEGISKMIESAQDNVPYSFTMGGKPYTFKGSAINGTYKISRD